jgi:hypothetical protein
MPMPADFYGWMNVFIGVGLAAIGTGYIASPRFVEWMLTKDRRGLMWARLLGHEKATIAVRYGFSLVLIAIGASLVYFSL